METKHEAGAEASGKTARICDSSYYEPKKIWAELRAQAERISANEPVLSSLVEAVVLRSKCLGEALSARLSRKLSREDMGRDDVSALLREIFREHPKLVDSAAQDLGAINGRDPACDSPLEALLFFKGFAAITTYRVSHQLWKNGRKSLAYYFQSLASEVFAVDIHPAARIGCGILLDHGTSFVVGETAIIEDDVSILHEVTLGGTGKVTGARHPIVRSGVLLGAGAKILGRVEIGEGAKIGAGSVVLTNIPAHTTAAGVPAILVGQTDEENPAYAMDQRIECARSIDFQI